MIPIKYVYLRFFPVWLFFITLCIVVQSGQPIAFARVKFSVLGQISGYDTPNSVAVLRNGRIVLYTADGALWAWDLAEKRKTQVALGEFRNLTISPTGDRIAWDRPHATLANASAVWWMPIDGRTGMASGSAEMVHRGHDPRFSPDGKSIALAGVGLSPFGWAYVVPVAGGDKWHTTFEADTHHRVFWSSDGKALLTETAGDGAMVRGIQRIDISTGAKERKFLVPDGGDPGGKIWVSDGRIAFYRPAVPPMRKGHYGDGLSYVTSDGRRGELPLPADSQLFVSSWDAGSTHLRALVRTDPAKTYLLDVANGAMRMLDSKGGESSSPVWSEDGQRIAFIERRGWERDILVMDKDGKNRRRYPVAAAGPAGEQMVWSPDGKRIAFAAAPRGAIAILDLKTGKATKISSAPGDLHSLIWRRNSRAIRIWKGTERDPPNAIVSGSFLKGLAPQASAIYEVGLDGTEQLLNDLTPQLSGFRSGKWLSENLIVLTSAERRVIFPAIPGPIVAMGAGYGRLTSFAPVASDGTRVLVRGRPTADTYSLTLTTIDGSPMGTLNLSVPGYLSASQLPIFLKRENAVLVVVDSMLKPMSGHPESSQIFIVPLDDSPPRLLATLPGSAGEYDQFQLSPDGKTLAMTVIRGPRTAQVLDLDLRSILPHH